MEEIDALVKRLRRANAAETAAIRKELVALASGPDGARVRDTLDTLKRGELLEVQWELEEIVELTSPRKPAAAAAPAAPPPEEEPPPPDPNRPLTSADLRLVYDDPRGLMLHRSKVGERWFATQADPHTGQPQTFELHPQEVEQIKGQLQSSPYWLLGG